MKIKTYLLAFLLLPSGLIAQQNKSTEELKPDLSASYRLYERKSGRKISLTDLTKQMKQADVLVFGEEHNDSIAHQVQLQILSKMLETYPQTALSLEMFSTDVQPIIDEYLKGLISEKNFIKEARAWNNYKDYRPLLELAKVQQTDVIGGNVAARYSNVVTMSGLTQLLNFPENARAYLPPLPVDTATGRYYAKFTETLGGHAMGNMKIYQTQNLWDASMAWNISKYAAKHPDRKIFQLNGRFHSDEHLGLLIPLNSYAPKLRVLTISAFPAKEGADWKEFKHLGDFILMTPLKETR